MNIAEKLASEIRRVTELKAQYEALDGTHGVNVKPAIHMMDAALKYAIKSAGLPDAVTQIAALRDLEGFTS